MQTLLSCPKCHNVLLRKENQLVCENCGIHCIVNGELYDFMGDNAYYWNEITLKEMEETLELAKVEGWRAAARKVGFKHPNLAEYILSNARADWLFHCIDYSKTKTCLDIGSGWGSNAFILANYFDKVWSLEAVKQRLEFQQIRQKQDKITNIKFVRSDWLRLPFPDNYFDLVVSNGVLEWVGLSDYFKNPHQVQVDFLKEIRRVLKTDGCLYVGIENRFALSSFLGAKDHTGLSYTSIIPRKVADLIVRTSGKTGEYRQHNQMNKWGDYRTYTYSMTGYNKLLKEAEYYHIDFYWSRSYNMPRYSGRFDDGSFRFYLRLLRSEAGSIHSIGSLLTYIGTFIPNNILKWANRSLCESFLIYAYKSKKGVTFESKIICAEDTDFLKLSGGHSMESKINYLLIKGNELKSVLKFPRGRKSTSVTLEETKMAAFNNINVEKQVIDAVTIFTEPALNGKHPQPHNLSQNLKAIKWLLNFQNATRKGYWDYDELKANIQDLTDFLTKSDMEHGLKIRTIERMGQFAESLKKCNLPRTAEHGDYCSLNIIINHSNTYVIDWEFYEENGDPLFDFIFFILCNAATGNLRKSFRNNFSQNGKYFGIVDTLIKEYAKAKDLPPDIIWQAFPYVILRCIRRSSVGENNRHLNSQDYIRVLTLWDEVYHDPLTFQTSNSPLA